MMAPVDGSGVCPAWTARVAKPQSGASWESVTWGVGRRLDKKRAGAQRAPPPGPLPAARAAGALVHRDARRTPRRCGRRRCGRAWSRRGRGPCRRRGGRHPPPRASGRARSTGSDCSRAALRSRMRRAFSESDVAALAWVLSVAALFWMAAPRLYCAVASFGASSAARVSSRIASSTRRAWSSAMPYWRRSAGSVAGVARASSAS